MRFMMLVIPKAYEKAGADFVPPVDLIAKMTKYNESLTKAGVLLGFDGLQPPAKAARVRFAGGKPTVTDGPFAEAKELVGGYWMIQVKSKEEAVEWAKRAPMLEGDVIEVRQVQELSDFPPDVQEAARMKGGEAHSGLPQERLADPDRGARPQLERRAHPQYQRKAQRDRRAIQRSQGSDRWVRRARVGIARGGDRGRGRLHAAAHAALAVVGGRVRGAPHRVSRSMTSDPHRAIEAVWRIESARLIAGLARLVRDVGLAEDLAQDALLAALERWPESGVPDNPGAWLMATAKHRAIDLLRRHQMLERKHEELGYELEARQEQVVPDLDAAIDDDFGDDLLRLMFTACHPVLSTEARVALTLRLLGGLSTAEIARAFLVPEATIAQRIVRAKRTLAEARVPFEVPPPRGAERAARLSSVLEVLYLTFNEGYSATAGDDWVRPELCEDALRLGRILAELTPTEPEVHGLVALMEIQASRLRARIGASGEPILLLDQDRARWDQLLIRRGLAALERSEQRGGALGPYALQAAIAACHARARTPEETDWTRITALYDALAQLTPSPVVELNRAVAYAMAFGPAAGLEIADALTSESALEGYHLLPSVRGDLLQKLGRFDEARAEFARAAALTRNTRERELLLERAARLPAS